MGIGIRELIVLALIVLVLWPNFKIVARAGFSPLWALLLLVPILNVIALWVFAYAKWPAQDRKTAV